MTQLEEKRKLGTERHFKEHSVEAVLEKENEERGGRERERERFIVCFFML
uniref:Bm14419 n=1 Tax=Brugia malayi TaxID=6279 RepID=A0A1I9G4D0_BRUMA|nr:Bm14419 [Brugia malayi]